MTHIEVGDPTFDRPFLERYQGSVGAFGDPDGKRADIQTFVDVTGLRSSAAYSPDDGRVRVVVGRKGSGKTVYLRRLRANAESDHSVHAVVEEAEQTQLLGTRHVMKVCHWFPEVILTEVWQQVWGRAILYSVASHLLTDRRLQDHVTSIDKDELRRDFAKVIGTVKNDPRSPFTAVKLFIDRYKSQARFLNHLDDPLWDDLEGRVSHILKSCPPIYIYVDAIDEEFSHAPMYWLRCQKGLFYETMRLLRHSGLGSNLHVVVSIRDLVLSSIFRSEHASRYIGDPHVRVLSWSIPSARELLDAKVQRLDRRFVFPGRPAPQTMVEWIGLTEITNRLGEIESPDLYALRHTQSLPRDVILLGNYVGEAVAKAIEQGETKVSEKRLLDLVSDLATFSCLIQIEIAANQVRSDEVPAEASQFGFTDSYLSVSEYADQRATHLMRLLGGMETLRITATQIARLERDGRDQFEAPDLPSILWQVGLLGFTENDRDTFYSVDRMARFRLPRDYDAYVFHPSLKEAVGLAASGRRVGP